MATIPLKDITFPGLDNTYTIPEIDNTLSTAGKAADAKKTGDEIDQLKSKLNTFEPYTYTDADLTTDNSYIGISDGALRTDSTNFHSSKLITIPRNATKIRINKSGAMTGGAVVAFYTGYKFSSTTFISGITVPDVSALPIDVNIPSNAVYMAFTGRKANEFEATLDTNKVAVFVENAKYGTQLELTAGSVGVDGSITYGQTTISNYISQLLHKTDFQSVRIVPHRGYQCNYALFNNGTFVSRGTWMGSNSVLNIDNAYDCILMFASETTESKTAEQMLLEYDVQIIAGVELQTVYNNLQNAEKNLNAAKSGTAATVDGIVTACFVDKGASVEKGAAIMEIESDDEYLIKMKVSKFDITSIRTGQKAEVRIGDKIYDGEVERINQSAENDASGKAKAVVEIKLHTTDALIVGLDADVTLKLDEKADTLGVPNDCIFDDDNGSYLYMIKDGVVTKVYVTTGVRDNTTTEVEGIEEGDHVVMDPSVIEYVGEEVAEIVYTEEKN